MNSKLEPEIKSDKLFEENSQLKNQVQILESQIEELRLKNEAEITK